MRASKTSNNFIYLATWRMPKHNFDITSPEPQPSTAFIHQCSCKFESFVNGWILVFNNMETEKGKCY